MENELLIFILVGFAAQVVDGALGMAYGVTATSVLMSVGVSPAAASASVHVAEVFTTFASGVSHQLFGNIRRRIFRPLVIPGVLGAVLGAYILSSLPGEKLKPFIAVYLLLMGMRILWKARKELQEQQMKKHRLSLLGFVGGFLDAVGGGGWGPVVTSTLLAKGHDPRITIGSVNLAEFFVAFAASFTFILTIGLGHWQIIVGLLIGGVLGAPLAAYVCKIIPAKKLMVIVGVLIILLSVRTLYFVFA